METNDRFTAMVALFVATSRRLVLLQVVCMSSQFQIKTNSNFVDTESRFAFVEYESRRDADDAYHEMHNKRIGRDDLLKIEVGGFFSRRSRTLNSGLTSIVGPYSSISLLAL